MDTNANQLHFKFTAFNSSMRVTVYAELCVSRNCRIFKILSIQRHRLVIFFGKMWVALKRAGCCGVAFGGYVNCACISQVFQQLINTMLCPGFFSGNSSVNLFAVYLFKYKLFIKIWSSSLNTML